MQRASPVGCCACRRQELDEHGRSVDMMVGNNRTSVHPQGNIAQCNREQRDPTEFDFTLSTPKSAILSVNSSGSSPPSDTSRDAGSEPLRFRPFVMSRAISTTIISTPSLGLAVRVTPSAAYSSLSSAGSAVSMHCAAKASLRSKRLATISSSRGGLGVSGSRSCRHGTLFKKAMRAPVLTF